MPRLPAITDRQLLPESARPYFDLILESRPFVGGPLSVVLPYAPEIAASMARLGDELRACRAIPRALHELAVCATAQVLDNAYVWTSHSRSARRAGVTGDVLDRLKSGAAPGGGDADQDLIVRFARELAGSRVVSQDCFDAVRRRFGDAGVAELSVLVGYYALIDAVAKAMHYEGPPGEAQRGTSGA